MLPACHACLPLQKGALDTLDGVLALVQAQLNGGSKLSVQGQSNLGPNIRAAAKLRKQIAAFRAQQARRPAGKAEAKAGTPAIDPAALPAFYEELATYLTSDVAAKVLREIKDAIARQVKLPAPRQDICSQVRQMPGLSGKVRCTLA